MTENNTEKLTLSERRRRIFSEDFKRKKVQEIETGQSRVCDICKQYQVSKTNVHRWISKFGSMRSKKERLIVETQSDTIQNIELKKRVAELERIVGQKQIIIDFQEKMIDLAEEEYGIDIKKKFERRPLSTSQKNETNTPIR
ncbi:MAG: transposase [Crenarchaeota archaeon]|jgi:transposase-like protein|nr:transposase [Thermoproteota archaeon]OQA84619.1 MAG: Transposase [Bacteroidetes bacterium ADurb.Bin234]